MYEKRFNKKMAQSCFCRFLSLPVILYTAERTDARCNGTGRRMCVLLLSEVQNNSIYLTRIPSIPGNKIKPPRYQPATRRYLLAACILCLAQSFPTISSEIVVQQCIISRETHRESTQGPSMHCTPKMSILL